MTAVITGSEIRTCFGDSAATFAALAEGRCGVGVLRSELRERLGVTSGYHAEDEADRRVLRASGWLTECVRAAVAQSGVDPARRRVAVVVGTGLRELHAVELMDDQPVRTADLHFDRAVRRAVPEATQVITVCNACSASGHALAIACDLLELDEADAVVAAGCDAMTDSMLAMIGRVAEEPTDRVRPFDADRMGVLLGEGAAAVVVERGDRPRAGSGAVLATVLGVGLSCDAFHETAPDPDGIVRAVRDAHRRAGIEPDQVDLVVAHGTGTALNDPVEATALGRVFGHRQDGPLVTGIKGATGHTSGAAALTSLAVAVHALAEQTVPAVTGLREPIAEAAGLRVVTGRATSAAVEVAQVNSFGFGGVNAVCIVGRSA
ncbi:beta-ketoacyl synthase N-terminal-like domain-containing protein [Streptacidiphilus neutrinimicus]|uniref:beta-ketoacyl synthase N-terminal-like domain-containing protein n=1 Tax=Streptacidiphilus neutrinimicus TaxID=105420 RepID=UPI0005A64790|nr:beta-ketoacyl synthase N-terminal-like domain-containing protein [Streptacidiphilus neutrinimicus]